ncbi:hypothetical protein AVEN_189596-1 [Araneus ventricosus]|uniref:RNase H type-1 domain-containing protein n=1 Tax=Araneus ventricosus TaxID=182803 RepID=A0A4Y2TXB7_ARAVE|nr:hypothetical protein AVEN_189596-1 [Araneus ventricosus]
MAPRKAPGLDGLTVEMLRAVHTRCPQFLCTLLNKCLSIGCFQENWKFAKLVLLAKPGKDPTLTSSYRPICLLSVVGKVLDKLLTQRFTFLCQQQGLLHPRQHGFQVGRSCETANDSLRREISSALRNRGKACLISLDVAGASDSVWRHSVLSRLVLARCPHNLYRITQDYFLNRHHTATTFAKADASVSYYFDGSAPGNCWGSSHGLKARQVFTKFQVFTLKVVCKTGQHTFRSLDYQSSIHRYDSHPLSWRPIQFHKTTPLGFDIEVFTDGSKLNGQVGSSAVVFYNGSEIQHLMCRLPDHASVFDAEIRGLDMALTLVQGMEVWHPVRIYTDSLWLLQALAATITSHPAVWSLKQKSMELMEISRLDFHWVKAHVGVSGNELADKYAKRATTRPTIDLVVLKSVTNFKMEVQSELQYLWQARWMSSEKGRQTAQFFPMVDFEQKFYNHRITQLIKVHGRFPYYFKRFGISDNELCNCGRLGDANHYFNDCPRTCDLRARLKFDASYMPSLFENKSNLAPLDDIMKRVVEFVPNL